MSGERWLVPADERFWSQVDAFGVCWEWAGGVKADGYACIRINGKRPQVHRYAYESLVGPVPAGLELDHLCRNRLCVNPDHLEPVTPRVNTLRSNNRAAINARKTHCQEGHAYDEANTYRSADGRHRKCRICERARSRRRQAAARAARAPFRLDVAA